MVTLDHENKPVLVKCDACRGLTRDYSQVQVTVDHNESDWTLCRRCTSNVQDAVKRLTRYM